MEATSVRLRGDALPRAVPVALAAAGALLEAAALERWTHRDAPANASPARPPDAPSFTALSLPPEASPRVALRRHTCFPRFAVRFRPGEAHFPETQLTRLTPIARWMSEHPGASVEARAALDDGPDGEPARRATAEMRGGTLVWRLVALGVPRDRLAWRVDADAPRSPIVRFGAAGFLDCPGDAPDGDASGALP
ncbi:MAG: hypothetical protein U0324_09355 [Polyangiales bacterium]